jgi:hypothetical protein
MEINLNIDSICIIQIFYQSLNTKKIMTYANGNPGLGLGQAQKCGGIKLVNGITTPNTHPILPSS